MGGNADGGATLLGRNLTQRRKGLAEEAWGLAMVGSKGRGGSLAALRIA